MKWNLANRICWKLKKSDNKDNAIDAGAAQNIFVLTILEKKSQARLKGSATSL